MRWKFFFFATVVSWVAKAVLSASSLAFDVNDPLAVGKAVKDLNFKIDDVKKTFQNELDKARKTVAEAVDTMAKSVPASDIFAELVT